MNRKQKIIISVTGIFIVLLILVGLTYAYFLTRIQGNTNTKSISVTTADLKLTYGDGNGDIVAEKIQPGTTIDTKTFTVKNEGNATVNNYAVYLEELVNTLSRTSDMVYTLTCTSNVSGKTCNGVNETTFPTQNGLIVTNNIDVNETQSYELKVVYKEMNIDQSEDMGKTIGAKVQIYNLADIVDITGTVTYASTGDYVEMQSTPKTSQIRDNKYFIPAVEPGVHTLYVKDKTGTVKGSKKITINKGSTSSVNGDVITVTSDSQTVTINITNISNTLTTNIGDVKDYSPFSDGTLANAIYTSAKQSGENRTTLGSTVTEFTSISGENERVLNTAPDDYGISYYFRGNVKDNYVQFDNLTYKKDIYIGSESANSIHYREYYSLYECENADTYNVNCKQICKIGDPILWRIVRINGDGTIRIILDSVIRDENGKIIQSAFNENQGDNAYLGYMYGTADSNTYEDTHKNINDSTVKIAVDKWYEDNLKANYESYLSDSLFCGDKTVVEGTGIATTPTTYSADVRNSYSTAKPSLKCAVEQNLDYSRYTVNTNILPDGLPTNGNLKYPIALISIDEVTFAGALKEDENSNYYLKGDYNVFWTMTPGVILKNNRGYEFIWNVENIGGIGANNIINRIGVRPVINLKKDISFNGIGTKTDPYKIIIN